MTVWKEGRPLCRVILPENDPAASQLARSTLSRYTASLFGHELPVARNIAQPGNYLVIGTPQNNPVVAELVERGAKLTSADLSDEGFQILTFQTDSSRHVILYARSPRAIKHACQELLFFRTSATTISTAIDWPLDVVMKPAFSYRGVYILPCWSAHDSLESWQRVLRFHSELTINRNWFWLDGFPVAGHTGEYAGTALASEKNVQGLIDLCNAEDMKFLIGGGWFTWHHHKAVDNNYPAGRDYYLAYLRTFNNFHGFYFEPTGEGSEDQNWRPECDMFRELIAAVLKQRPDFEFAVAIGKFNNPEYLRFMSTLDPSRVYWWWCWGDPFRDKALDLYRSVTRWHTIINMSNFHGSTAPPVPAERPLAGIVTSYDPGQGFGNPWDGWGKLGTDQPRNFDPYNIPFFAHQYFYRERCWNPDLSEGDFVRRLHRRLFDADAPSEAGELYWKLSRLTLECNAKKPPTPDQLAPIRRLVDMMRSRTFTPRTNDTVARMDDTLNHIATRSTRPGS